MLEPFSILKPTTVIEASQLLREYGDNATIYAGGTELIYVMKEHLTSYSHLIDIKQIPGLGEIALSPDGKTLSIGALATHRQIERSPLVQKLLPVFAETEANVANVRVRSMGTIGGNLCFADPHSDPATLLAALGATFHLESTEGQRLIPADQFFTSLMETEREPHELLTEIAIPIPHAGVGVAYERIKLHERPTAAFAAVISVQDGVVATARLIVGCIGETPQVLAEAVETLLGERPSIAVARHVSAVIADETKTEDDGFESEGYKRQLARTVGYRAITAALGLAEARHAA